MATVKTIFIAACLQPLERETRKQLLQQKFCAVLWSDVFTTDETKVSEEEAIEMAKKAIAEYDGMAVAEMYSMLEPIKQLIAFCKKENFACHIIQEDYSLRPPWAS